MTKGEFMVEAERLGFDKTQISQILYNRIVLKERKVDLFSYEEELELMRKPIYN